MPSKEHLWRTISAPSHSLSTIMAAINGQLMNAERKIDMTI